MTRGRHFRTLTRWTVLLGLAFLLLGACLTATPTPTPTPTSVPTATATPQATPFIPHPIAYPTPPPQATKATVTRVIDGDTIEIQGGLRVRYIGINTPETYGGVECFGREATAKNKELVLGREVILEKDVSETDRYGRLLRYVYLPNGIMVNAELVRLGYAQASSYPPDVKHQALFRQLEREAREAGRGLWGICP